MASLRPRNKIAVEVPVAAMADCAFLLIIFFIITSSFRKPARLAVELPGEAPTQQAELAATTPRIRVTADKVLLNNFAVPLWQLGADLNVLLADKPKPEDRVVILTGDDSVPMERIVEVMDAVRSVHAHVGYVNLEER
jgi:biopolymer transport protein ExbD